MKEIEKFSPNLNKLPFMLLYGMLMINLIIGMQLYGVAQYTSAWFFIPFVMLMAMIMATIKWYVFYKDKLVEKGFFSTKEISFKDIRKVSWENGNDVLAIEYTNDPDRVMGDVIRVIGSRVINFERFLEVLSERVGFDGETNRDYQTEKKYLKIIQNLGFILLLLLIVALSCAFSRDFFHFNNTFPLVDNIGALGLLMLVLTVPIFLHKHPFSDEFESIGLLFVLIVFSGILSYLMYHNIQNEKSSSDVQYHDFKLEWSSESYQNWKSLSLQLKNDNNEFELNNHWHGFNLELEDGKTYKIPVHMGKNNDYMFSPDAFKQLK